MNFEMTFSGFATRSVLTFVATCASLAATVAVVPRPTSADVLITEINSNAAVGGDFFEIYNPTQSAIDLTGWRWSDYDVRNWATAQVFGAATLNPGEVAVVGVGNNTAVPNPLWGSSAANDAYRAAWGLPTSVKMPTWTGTGAGLGNGDGVVLFSSAGNVSTSLIYRIGPLVSATSQDLSTVALSTFVKSFEPQPTANGHAGVMGGVGASPAGVATESLVWDPTSGLVSPTYRNAVVSQWGAFANPTSAVTIGSPGVINAVPEPSSIALCVIGGTVAAFGIARRRAAVRRGRAA